MASKGKKKKAQPMSLSQFHAITPSATTGSSSEVSGGGGGGGGGGVANQPSQIVRMNWADEMDKLDDSAPPSEFVFDRSVLPTAPKAALKSNIDLELVPKKPPFRAFISNVSFEADEEKLRYFFKDTKIAFMSLTTDLGGRFKGCGHIDFEDRDSLIAALNKNEMTYNSRPIKVALLEKTFTSGFNRQGQQQQHQQHQQQSGDSGPLKSDEANWRRSEPEPESEQYGGQQQQQQQYGRYGPRDREGGASQGRYQNSEQGRYQSNDQGRYQRRTDGQSGRTERGSFGGYQNKPPTEQRRQYGGGERGSGGGGGYSDSGRGGYNDSGRGGYNDSGRQRYGDSGRQEREHSSGAPVAESEAPKGERPKLNLIPRTLPVAEETNVATNASIFGSAKPVNTAAREREIEERLKEKEKAMALEKEKQQKAEQESGVDEVSAGIGAANLSGEDEESDAKPKSNHDEPHHNRPNDQEFGAKKHFYNKHDDNNNTSSNNKNSHQRAYQTSGSHRGMAQSNSFTSPNNRGGGEGARENAWGANRNVTDLFSKQDSSDRQNSDDGFSTNRRISLNKRPDSQQNRPPTGNRDNNKERRPFGSSGSGTLERNKDRNSLGRGSQPQQGQRSGDRRQDSYANVSQKNANLNEDLGIASNKFAFLDDDADFQKKRKTENKGFID